MSLIAVFTCAVNRHLHTGQEAESKVYGEVAASLPINLFKYKGISKLRSAFKLYKHAMAMIHRQRHALHAELDGILKMQQFPVQKGSEEYAEEVGSCCQSEGGDSTVGSAWMTDDEAQSVHETMFMVKEHLNGCFRRNSSISVSGSKHFHAPSAVQTGELQGPEKLLKQLEYNFAAEMSERVQLSKFAAVEVFKPLSTAYLFTMSYPYLVEIPRVLGTFLDLVDEDPCLRSMLLAAGF